MAEFTIEALVLSQKTIETMSFLLERSMRGLQEGTKHYAPLVKKKQAYAIAESLILRDLQGVQPESSTKEELEEALKAVESELQKLGEAPPKMDCCSKLKSLLARQRYSLGVASILINEELSQFA